ncbi:MAG: CPBP family intramembrane metalloprotease [bacterium]|nr:CPBP family intramembrane metalloprotease [bacterium]MCM1374360.1 CPBP family intramembrane metalloprotease [Muribaculum sp.]
MVRKTGRILKLIAVAVVGVAAGTVVSVLGMAILGEAVKLPMTEYFETSMSGSLGIVLGTGLLLLYMRKSQTWREALGAGGKCSAAKLCGYAVVAVCVCKFVFGTVSAFVLSRLLSGAAGGPDMAARDILAWEEALLSVFGIAVAPIAEELLFRKCLYGAFRKEFGVVFAMAVNVILFAALHGYGVQGFLSCALAGYVFAHLYERTGNIGYSMAAHLFCNLEAFLSPMMKRTELWGKPLCYEVNGYDTYHAAVFVCAVLVIAAYLAVRIRACDMRRDRYVYHTGGGRRAEDR